MPKGFAAACLYPHLQSFICGNNTTSDATCHSFPADLPQLIVKSNVIKAFSKVFLNEFRIFSSSVYVFDAFFFFFFWYVLSGKSLILSSLHMDL